MTAIEMYEIKAEAFRRMTGHMAPGKDASVHSYPAPYEERVAAWEKWRAEHGEIISAMLGAFRAIMGDGTPLEGPLL